MGEGPTAGATEASREMEEQMGIKNRRDDKDFNKMKDKDKMKEREKEADEGENTLKVFDLTA